jgi:hypothetical protein
MRSNAGMAYRQGDSIQCSLQKEHISLDYISEGSKQSVTHQKRSNNVWLPATLPSTDRPLYSPTEHAASSTHPATKTVLSHCNSQRPSGQSLLHIQAVHLSRHIFTHNRLDEALRASSLYSCQSSMRILAVHALLAFTRWPQSRLHHWCGTKQTHL